jgi:hypothetical protein
MTTRATGRGCRIGIAQPLIGLLLLDAFLLVCERTRWPAVAAQKGLAVLTSVAAVLAFSLVVLFWFLIAALFRRQFQFGVRSLLLLPLVVAVPCSWLTAEIRAAEKQRKVLKAECVQWRYDCVDLDASPPPPVVDAGALKWGPSTLFPPPEWLLRELGIDFFADVVWVNAIARADSGHFEQLVGLPRIESVCIGGNCDMSSGLDRLGGLPRLRELNMNRCNLDEARLRELGSLKHLKELSLERSLLWKAGLAHIVDLTELRILNLGRADLWVDTRGRQPIGETLGNDALPYVARLTQLRVLNLNDTSVTDAGLQGLRNLTELAELRLRGTAVTDAGLRSLSELKNLRVLDLNFTGITAGGLKYLMGLGKLEELDVRGNDLTTDGVKKLECIQRNEEKLKALGLTKAEIEARGIEYTKGLIKLDELKELEVPGRTNPSMDGVAELARLQGLRHLWVRAENLGGNAKLAELKKAMPNCQIDD